MSTLPVYLIDTSYLLELFAVPGCSTEAAVAEVKQRVSDAARNGRPAVRHCALPIRVGKSHLRCG